MCSQGKSSRRNRARTQQAVVPARLLAGVGVLLTLLALLTLGLPAVPVAHAGASLVVNTLSDADDGGDGVCSLREAITAANTDGVYHECTGTDFGADTITFSVSGTITLGSTLPAITDADGLTIAGPGAASLTISGNNLVQVMEVNSGATLNLQDLTVANGSADNGGGIINGGTLTITNSTFSGNSAGNGGGIFQISTNGGTLTITNSTFSGNSAGSGGGILQIGAVTVTNSTFSGNSAESTGGGISHEGGPLTVTNSTFSGNSAGNFGGGIITEGGPTLHNTIVANSPSGGNCSGPITDGGGNLDDGTTCHFSASTSQSNADDGLDPNGLQDNGGPSQTIALTAGSDALDAGVDSICAAEPVNNLDQRGLPRPVDGDGDNTASCDIGAFELQNIAPTVEVSGGQCNSDSSATATVKLTVGDVQTPAASLGVTATSNNQTLLPNGNLTLGGIGAARTLTLTAVAKKSGTATITVTVSDDDGATTTLAITVKVGTNRGDMVDGTTDADILFGLGGENTLNGDNGSDLLCGGSSRDTLNGGNGDDVLNGGSGRDTLNGNNGDDTLTGGPDADAFSGGIGVDTATDFTPSQGDTQDGTIP